MKKILVLVVILLSVATIVTGKMHWNNKIEATAKTAQVEKANKVDVKTTTVENEENKLKEIKALSRNMPIEIQTKLISAVQNSEPMKIVIAGSSATPEDLNGWPTLLKKELQSTYGENVLHVVIKEIADKTSTEVVEEGLIEEIINLSPDVLLLEPFILYDNGKVTIDQRLVNLATIIETVKKEIPELFVFLQPANPLHNATHYPREVNELKKYAEENKFTYLNHWDAWPDHQSEEINEYLVEGEPNDKGHELWAGFLKDYFIYNEQ